MKQVSSDAILIDILQLFFCMCYVYRIIFVKLEFCQDKSRAAKKQRRTHYGKATKCSIFTDLLVVVFFCIKFFFSQMTNYHDVDDILDNKYKGYIGEQYIELTDYADYYMNQY